MEIGPEKYRLLTQALAARLIEIAKEHKVVLRRLFSGVDHPISAWCLHDAIEGITLAKPDYTSHVPGCDIRGGKFCVWSKTREGEDSYTLIKVPENILITLQTYLTEEEYETVQLVRAKELLGKALSDLEQAQKVLGEGGVNYISLEQRSKLKEEYWIRD